MQQLDLAMGMVSFNCLHKICISDHDRNQLFLVSYAQSLFSCRDVITFPMHTMCEKGLGEFTGLIWFSQLQNMLII